MDSLTTFFTTNDFGTIVLWVLASIVLVPIAAVAALVAVIATIWGILRVVWYTCLFAATVGIIAGIVWLVLYMSGNLPL